MAGKADGRIRRRRVFYIPGYDPIHPRRYRELYRKEGAAQAALSGYEIELSARSGGGSYGWHVASRIDGQQVQAEFDVLVWSDIVRDSMSNTIPATYAAMARTAWAYIGSGALFRLMQLRKGPVIAALYPVLMLIFQALFALGAGYGLGLLAGFGVEALVNLFTGPEDGALAGALTFFVTLVLGCWMILRWFKRWDSAFFVYYLMHDYSYSARHKGANPPELEARLAEFTARIEAAMNSDVDEVLVVGHSSGAHLGVSVLADLIRSGRVGQSGPELGFLSLGQVVPMVSFLPKADRLRADLAYLSARDELAWVDVTAPGDGCAFALCDPVAVSGVAPADKCWPLVLSAAFTQTLSPERWRALRWRFFRLHFQYLCAFDRPGAYDYFQITSGPQSLRQRFNGRAASKSRIERAVNGFPSVAA